jgi:hypothetical protein
MGMNLKLSSSPNGTRNIGPINMGGGANLIQRSLFSTSTPTLPYSQYYNPGVGSPAVSTADYYHMNGIWRSKPYDLDTMGSEGATIKAREGMRYVWMMCGDHPQSTNYQGSAEFYVGYSNDPQIWPDPTTLRVLRRVEESATFTDEYGFSQTSFYVYHWPILVYNPDSAGDKFWVYAEGQGGSRQHETGLFTTSDFLTTTFVGPVISTQNFNGWTSLGYPTRLGTGSWENYCLGTSDATGTSPAYYKYTSTDGLSWTRVDSTVRAGPGDYTTISGQKYLLCREGRSDNDYVSLLAVDSSNVSLGTYTRISGAYGPSSTNTSVYPGPTYLQDVWGHEEDGVLSIYANRGYFAAGSQYTLKDGPFLNKTPTFYNITASITSNVLNITAITDSATVEVGDRLIFLSGRPLITSLGTGTGGNGTYNVEATSNITSQSVLVVKNGGLWQQFIDQYYYVTDATLAVDAAPFGVAADCVSGTVTISWNDCLPNRTYRVYRGTTVGTQATLIGDVTGVSITDTPTVGSQYFYKVVTLNSGVEKKSRIVNVYCSNNALMVTRHVNRVINDGGDATKIDMTFLASVDSYLTSNDYYKYLLHWVDARFGIKESGGFITKVYCLGTTRLPRGGDYTPTTSNTFPSTTSNTTYSSTSFRGTTPSWVNGSAQAHGYFGNGRGNTIQRKNEITLIGAYQRPSGTGVATLLGWGQFSSGVGLSQAAGSSGNISFTMYSSGGVATTATVAFASATAAHVAAGVFDGTNMTAYLDGVAGTPVSATSFTNPDMSLDTTLRGRYGTTANTAPVHTSGGRGLMTFSTRAISIDNEALFTGAGLMMFEKGLPSGAITAIGALYA